MPFLKGPMPVRRTRWFLEKGEMILRPEVKVLCAGYNFEKTHQPMREFVFWHFAQLQYKNPSLQLLKLESLSPLQYIMAFLEDGREVVLDCDGYARYQILDRIKRVLGKSSLLLKIEDEAKQLNPKKVSFGEDCDRQCMCEVEGQRPCPSVLRAPKYLQGRWRWNVNDKQNQ